MLDTSTSEDAPPVSSLSDTQRRIQQQQQQQQASNPLRIQTTSGDSAGANQVATSSARYRNFNDLWIRFESGANAAVRYVNRLLTASRFANCFSGRFTRFELAPFSLVSSNQVRVALRRPTCMWFGNRFKATVRQPTWVRFQTVWWVLLCICRSLQPISRDNVKQSLSRDNSLRVWYGLRHGGSAASASPPSSTLYIAVMALVVVRLYRRWALSGSPHGVARSATDATNFLDLVSTGRLRPFWR